MKNKKVKEKMMDEIIKDDKKIGEKKPLKEAKKKLRKKVNPNNNIYP